VTLYWIYPIIQVYEINIISFLAGYWVVSTVVCFTVWENARMPVNHRFIMDDEYEKKE
jgi:hypothetical protein